MLSTTYSADRRTGTLDVVDDGRVGGVVQVVTCIRMFVDAHRQGGDDLHQDDDADKVVLVRTTMWWTTAPRMTCIRMTPTSEIFFRSSSDDRSQDDLHQDDLHQDDDLVMVIRFQAGGWRVAARAWVVHFCKILQRFSPAGGRARVGGPASCEARTNPRSGWPRARGWSAISQRCEIARSRVAARAWVALCRDLKQPKAYGNLGVNRTRETSWYAGLA